MADEMRRLANARRHLQNIIFCVALVGVFGALPWIVSPPPTPPRLSWLPDMISVIILGLPTRAGLFAATFPLQAAAVVGLLWLLRRGMRSIARVQREVALRGHARDPMPLGETVAMLVTWLHWPVVLLTVTLVAVVSLDLVPSARQAENAPAPGEDRGNASCVGTRGKCQLAVGEVVKLAIRSNEVNYTGIWLAEGDTYCMRSLDTSEWTDKGKVSHARGFSFEENIVRLPRFWWAEWLRPLPDGLWFQVVAWVDNASPAFRALGDDPDARHCWKAVGAGELVLTVNDIILGNNTGTMTLELQRGGTGGQL